MPASFPGHNPLRELLELAVAGQDLRRSRQRLERWRDGEFFRSFRGLDEDAHVAERPRVEAGEHAEAPAFPRAESRRVCEQQLPAGHQHQERRGQRGPAALDGLRFHFNTTT